MNKVSFALLCGFFRPSRSIPVRAFTFRTDPRFVFMIARNPLMLATFALVLINRYFLLSHEANILLKGQLVNPLGLDFSISL
jgi:hypothetical protein